METLHVHWALFNVHYPCNHCTYSHGLSFSIHKEKEKGLLTKAS